MKTMPLAKNVAMISYQEIFLTKILWILTLKIKNVHFLQLITILKIPMNTRQKFKTSPDLKLHNRYYHITRIMNGLLSRICTAAFQKAKAEVIDAMVIFKACCNRGRHESKLKKCLLLWISTFVMSSSWNISSWAELKRIIKLSNFVPDYKASALFIWIHVVFLELNFYDLAT